MVDAFIREDEMLFHERARGAGTKTGEAGFLRPDAKQAEIDGLAGVNPLLFGIELLVAMTDLIGSAVGETNGAGTVGSDLPKVKFVVEDNGRVVFGPASNAEGGLLLDGPVGFAIDENGRDVFGDVDDRVRGGVHGPIIVFVKVEKIAAAGAFFQVVVVIEPVLNFGAGAGGQIDEGNVARRAADRALHRVGGPVVRDGERLMLERNDSLVQIFAQRNKRILPELPGVEHVFLAIVLGAEFLLGHDLRVAPVPDGDGRRLFGILVLILLSVFWNIRRL